jgi:hypothetical protein
MTAPYTATSFASAGSGYTNEISYKDTTVTVANGDLIIAFGVSENCDAGGTGDIVTQAGSTGAWTIVRRNNTLNTPGFVMGYATATAGGSVTVRVWTPHNLAGSLSGNGVWVLPASEWSGTPHVHTFGANDTDGLVSVTLDTAGSVFYAGGDWSALNPGTGLTPAGTSDSVYYDAVHYAAMSADWSGQAAGTRNYGPSAPAGNDWIGAALVVDAPSTASFDSGPNSAGASADLGGGTGAWSGVANATGAPNNQWASWTSP